MAADQGLLVEFVGLPASGKSHLARKTRDCLSLQNFGPPDARPSAITTSRQKREHGRDRLGTVRQIGSQPIRSPGATVAAVRAHLASRQRHPRKTLRFVLYHLYLRTELQRARRANELHLADQGFLQHLRRVHLTAHADGAVYLRQLAETCYPPLHPDLVVFVEVAHRTRMERAIERGTEIDEALLDPDHPAIQADHDSYRDIKDLVPRLAADLDLSMRTMTIDNRADNLDANVARIAGAIRELWTGDDTASPAGTSSVEHRP